MMYIQILNYQILCNKDYHNSYHESAKYATMRNIEYQPMIRNGIKFDDNRIKSIHVSNMIMSYMM